MELIDLYKIEQPQVLKDTIFIVGDKNAAAVHSETPITERLFRSVTFQELYDRCNWPTP